LKRLLDTWDRNGSTSGPTSWQIRWWWCVLTVPCGGRGGGAFRSIHLRFRSQGHWTILDTFRGAVCSPHYGTRTEQNGPMTEAWWQTGEKPDKVLRTSKENPPTWQ
jgi:hypothetical protein